MMVIYRILNHNYVLTVSYSSIFNDNELCHVINNSFLFDHVTVKACYFILMCHIVFYNFINNSTLLMIISYVSDNE